MKPVAIFRHSLTEGPGYFATWLDAHDVPWKLIRVDSGDAIPERVGAFSGLCFMGGPMSVNDPLAWIAAVLQLIRRAAQDGVPVIGHCLGGQLLSKALGGVVSRNPVKEIGWGSVTVQDNVESRRWFGSLREFLAFHWHGETFTIPQGAIRLLASRYCANQAFALGPHLGLQCHVEMNAALIRAWCENWERELQGIAAPSVQTPAQIVESIEQRVSALNAVADVLYSRWIEGLAG